jgi:hydrogenase maturation protease
VNRVLILCLGNEVLSDDRFGLEIAECLTHDCPNPNVDVLFASIAGFGLIDILKDREKVLIVDTILTGKYEPGTIHYFPVGDLAPSNGLIHSHQINLPTALEVGRKFGEVMPQHIHVLAVEAQDVTTLSEQLTPPVAGAIEGTLERIRLWISTVTTESVFESISAGR